MRASLARFAPSKIVPAAFFSSLKQRGFESFYGVPDSLLKDLCAYISDNVPTRNHIITANEGNAVAMASGYHLATGRFPVVYLQNSGVGNCLNPVLSMAHREVYKLPMLMLIGWRGDPGGKHDEPQHVAQGRLMTNCLDAMEVPYAVLSPAEPEAALEKAQQHLREAGTPFAILIKRDSFETYKLANKAEDPPRTMSREEAIDLILSALGPRDAVVGTTGMPSREIFEIREKKKHGHARDFLTVGAMGHGSSIAAGIALASPDRQVVMLDGDGAALMHMGSLAVIGGTHASDKTLLKNFKHIVVNNGAHDSVGGQPTVGFNVDLTLAAQACGYNTIRPTPAITLPEVKGALDAVMKCDGPAFLEIRVKKGNRADLGRPTTTPIQNKEAFMVHLAGSGYSSAPKA